MQYRRRQKLHRFLKRIALREVFSVMNTWKGCVQQKIWLRRYMHRMVHQKTFAAYSKGMRTWKHAVNAMKLNSVQQSIADDAERRQRRAMKQVLGRIIHRTQGIMMTRWITYWQDQKKYRRIGMKIMHRQLAQTFHRWYNQIQLGIAQRTVVRRFLKKMIHRHVVKCMDTWCDHVDTRKRLRKRMLVSMQRWSLAKLRMGMRKWIEHSDEARRMEQEDSRQQQVCKRIMKRMANRRFSCVFNTWLEHLSTVRRIRRFLMRVKNSQLHSCFSTWVGQVDAWQQQRLLVQRSMSRVINGTMHRCLDTWCDHVDTRKRLRKRILVSMQRWSLAKLRMGMRKWIEHSDEARRMEQEDSRQQQVCKRIMKRMANRRFSCVFNTWLEHLSTVRRIRRFLMRVKNSQLHSCFSTWVGQVDAWQQQRLLVQRSMSRVINGTMHRCFDKWCDLVDLRKRLRKRMLVTMKRRSVARLQSGLIKWKVFNILAQSKEEHQTNQQQSVKRIVSRMLHRRVGQVFDRWLLFLGKMKRMRSFISKWFHAQQNKIFNTWYDNVQEQLRYRRLLSKSIVRVQKGSVVRCLRTWMEHVRLRVVVRARMNVSLKRWSVAQLQWGLKKWHLFLVHHRNHSTYVHKRENYMKRMVLKLYHRQLVCCFDSWCECVENRKKLQVLMKKVMNSTLHATFERWKVSMQALVYERIVLKKFSKKMKNRSLLKSWTTWMALVEVRVQLRRRMKVSVQRWSIAQLRVGVQKWVAGVNEIKRNTNMLSVQHARTKRMLSKILHRVTSKCFYIWYDSLLKKRRVVKYLKKIQNMHLAQSFTTWSCRTIEFQRQKLLIHRCLARALQASVARCFTMWNSMLERRNWLRRLVEIRVTRWSLFELRYGWTAWNAFVRRHRGHASKRERETYVAKKIIGRIVHRQKYTYYRKWCALVREKRKLVRFMLRMKNMKMYSMYAMWKNNVGVIKEQKRRLARTVSRSFNSKLHSCMDKWCEFVNDRSFLRKRMVVATKRWRLLVMNQGYRRWVKYSDGIGVQNKEKEMKQKRMKQIVGRIVYRCCFIMFSKWKQCIIDKKKL